MELISAIKLQSNSLRQFALDNQIAYAVLHDICSGKKSLFDCKVSTVKKIANGLHMGIDELLAERAFPQFRDSLHNSIRQSGDILWLIRVLQENKAIALYLNGELLHAIYLVCMIDYVCDKHGLPLPEEYQSIRELKLKKPYYVGDWDILVDEGHIELKKKAIPEFLRNNIFECEVYDAV